ncbi:MAG: AAA family ATPase, partial [Methanobrevibacter sp.]|nr:AAA family ATPase [Methanobrevibacter sp.]
NFFKGNKKLFESLYIYDKWDWNENYPVIHLDMSKLVSENRELLELTLADYINKFAKEYNIKLNEKLPVPSNFSNLIEEIHEITNKRVVVLVDEYDAPILDNINNDEIADDNRRFLQNFYNVLKNSEKHLRFVFITGITKFAKTSIFSKLNNLLEITLDPKYSTICGITHKELEFYYKDQIQALSRELAISYKETLDRINFYYDGYSWDGENKVFNPFSTIIAFKQNRVSSYWFRSGTPSFLTEIFKNRKTSIDFFKPILIKETELDSIDPKKINETALLFQSGYLTISETLIKNKSIHYILKIPNFEVETAFKDNLMDLYIDKIEYRIKKFQEDIWKDLIENNCENLSKKFRAYIGGLPYYIRLSKDNTEKWKFYSLIFTTWARTLGFEISQETPMEDGRIDFVLENFEKEITMIVEMKYTEDQNKKIETLIKEGFKQIERKKYWWAYDNEVKLMTIALKDEYIDNGFITHVKCKIKEVPID